MADFQSLLSDPSYQALSPDDQLDIRQRFYDQHVSRDPAFQALSDVDRNDIRTRIIGEEVKPISDNLIGDDQSSLPTKAKSLVDYLKEGDGSVIEGAKAAPGAVVDLAKQVGKAAITA